jgi:hypothetical protein
MARWVAAAVAAGLGLFAALAFVAGNHAWDDEVIFSLGGTHGIHATDLFAVAPFTAGLVLAWWCLRQGGAA